VPDRRELLPAEDVHYLAFVDPSGGSKDAFSVAIAHRDGERIVIDCVRAWAPPFNPSGVVEEVAELLTSYGVSSVTGDRYAGEWPREQFRAHGIEYETSTRLDENRGATTAAAHARCPGRSRANATSDSPSTTLSVACYHALVLHYLLVAERGPHPSHHDAQRVAERKQDASEASEPGGCGMVNRCSRLILGLVLVSANLPRLSFAENRSRSTTTGASASFAVR
jgi:hypothetical protein